MSNYLALYDYRRRVVDQYRERNQGLLDGADPAFVLQRFREQRDLLFASHAQSALDEQQRHGFQGLRYFPYNPALRFIVDIDTAIESKRYDVAMDAQESMAMTRFGQVRFMVGTTEVCLFVYWLEIYGGGLFLPFRDATYRTESYGGGRYLFDTIKGSNPVPVAGDETGQRIILDFNYAYNPSCAYNDRWVCPLAPRDNMLEIEMRAGEMRYH